MGIKMDSIETSKGDPVMSGSSDMSAYQRWEHDMLEDIGHDTDALIKMTAGDSMSDSYDSGMLAGLLSSKGIDPGILALMNNNEFGGNGGMLFLLFLVILMGGGVGGWGGNGISGVDRTVINEGNFNQLMTAITSSGQTQANAIQALASNLNTDVAQINSALASMDKSIAVSNGDIRSAIQSCCCNIRTEIQATSANTNLSLERGFNSQNQLLQTLGNNIQTQASQLAYAQSQQANANTQSILSAIGQQTAMIQAEFCAIKNREDAKTIQDLRDKIAEQRDASNLAQILSAIQNKDTIATTIAGTLDSTAGTWTGTGTGTLSRVDSENDPDDDDQWGDDYLLWPRRRPSNPLINPTR